MSFSSLLAVEFKKLRRSKILIILFVPIVLVWMTAILNADLNFDMDAEGISPENNFLVQSFLGFVWFMLPTSIVILTVLLSQTERANRGLLKMLALPLNSSMLCLAKFFVLLSLLAIEIFLMFVTYFPSALIASWQHDYHFVLSIGYVLKICAIIFVVSIPMTAVYWLISVLIKNAVISVGIGLATVVPIVLAINIEGWFAYPMSYPMKMMTAEMHNVATKMGEFPFEYIPWIPVAVAFMIGSLGLACLRFGSSERK